MIKGKYPTDELLKKAMQELMFQKFDGQSFQIGNLLNLFNMELEKKGIEIIAPQKFYYLFYQIKNDLQENGMIKTIKHGYYFLSSEGVEDFLSDDEPKAEDDDVESEETNDSEVCTIGEGAEKVYCYYFPAYEVLARLKGETCFRCKIGKTQDIKKRFGGSKTDLPEHRKLALIIRTDHPDDVESLLHASLRLAGKQVEDAPGREWFLTNPAEITELYKSISVCISNKIA